MITKREPNNLAAQKDLEWTTLVERIAAGHGSAGEELYRRLRSIQFYFCRELGMQDAEDRYHNLTVALLEAIRRGTLRDPQKVVAYAWVIARRTIINEIDERCFGRKYETPADQIALRDERPSPEAELIGQEHKAIARRILESLPARHRDVLIRFYLHGHEPKRIQDEMGLTETQFRLIKSRAKARFISMIQRHMQRSTLAPHHIAG